jgi:hypothetical protein
MLAALSEAWVARFAAWSQPGGFGPTRAAWLERAAFLGETITIRLPEGPLSGRFIGLDPSGRLELETATGRRTDRRRRSLFRRRPAPCAPVLRSRAAASRRMRAPALLCLTAMETCLAGVVGLPHIPAFMRRLLLSQDIQ